MKKIMNKFLIIILAVALLTTVLPLSAGAAKVNEMNDVSSGQWYYNAVNYCLEKEYMRGVGIGRFMPEGIVTRAQMAQTLFNRAEDNSVDMERNKFTDVPLSQWYAPPIIWCQQQNVINGTSATTFSPNANVTREQVCVMVYNFYKGYLGEKPELADLSTMGKYTDWPSVSTWAREAVRWAVHTKFMSGKSATMLAPNGQATRAELAQFLLNFDKVLEGTGGTEPTPPPIPTHPYTASTLARVSMDKTESNMLMTLDGDGRLVYYDKNAGVLYRMAYENGRWTNPETFLDVQHAVCTVSVNGHDVTYTNMNVGQVFYDNVNEVFIIQGEFTQIDDTANEGWGNMGDPDHYRAAFIYENGQFKELMNLDGYRKWATFLCSMSNGRYMVSNRTDTCAIWDPITDTYTATAANGNHCQYIAQIGQEIYGVWGDRNSWSSSPVTTLYKFDLSSREWEDITNISGKCATYQNGLFFGWNKGEITTVRLNGQMKKQIGQEDILIADLTPIPESPSALLATTGGAFIFYDDNARAIRAVYPTPKQTIPTPEPPPPQFDYDALSRKLSGDWVNTDGFTATMKVSAAQTVGRYSIEITGGNWAQMYAVWNYEAVYDEASGTLKCSTGSRTDYSRFGTNTVYAGTGQAVFTLFDNGMLRWDNVSEQNADDLIASTVTFRKT